MPSLLRSGVGLLVVATLALLASLAASTAVAQTGVLVFIQPPGDADPVAISLDEVSDADKDIRDQTYKVAKATGGFRQITVIRGVSLVKLFQLADTDFNYARVELQRRNGTDLKRTREQVNDIGQLVFYTDPADGKTYFIGPEEADGVVAHKNYFEASPVNNVIQYAESKLKVKISPARKKIDPGGTITFKASVTGAGGGEVTYKWWLNGKRPRSGTNEHIQDFPDKDGVYEVSVSARVGDGTPDADVAKITVGDPDKADQQQPTVDTTTPGGTGDGSGAYDPTYTPIPAAPTPPAPTPTPEPTEPPDIATSGTPVEGNLLADASDPRPSNLLESAAAAAREGKQKDDGAAEGAGVPEAAISIAGMLALLGLGAGIESRQGRLPRPRLPRRAA